MRSLNPRDAVPLLWWLILGLGSGHTAWAQIDARGLAQTYQTQVDNRLTLPPDEVQRYGALALGMLPASGIAPVQAQYVAVVDRSPHVQAIFIYWTATDATPVLIGASPVSTGRPGQFDHFETPIGVFEHSLKNPDLLEQRLGSVQSKGCIRIPATLNRFLDHFGVLDADYESSTAPGPRLWVLSPTREPIPDAGRYLIVVDTVRSARPDWSPAPQ